MGSGGKRVWTDECFSLSRSSLTIFSIKFSGLVLSVMILGSCCVNVSRRPVRCSKFEIIQVGGNQYTSLRSKAVAKVLDYGRISTV